MKILVVAAHPDDEILGCGATTARLASEGHEVYFAILGEGITSRYDNPEAADLKLLAALHATSQAAARAVGAKEVFQFQFPDNRFDTVPLLDIIKKVEELVLKLAPEVIYTHHAGDLNIDHQITSRAVMTATRPLKDHPVREVYAFEIPSSTEWSFQRLEPIFRPNVFVEVAKTLESKIKAMACYESEARVYPHPRSPEALRAIAHRWGSVSGLGAAEAFELIRNVQR